MDILCGLKWSEIERLISLLDKAFISAANRDWTDDFGAGKERYQEISSNKALDFIRDVGNKMYETECNTPFPDEPYKVAQEITSGIRSKDTNLVYKGISGLLLGLFYQLKRDEFSGVEHVK